MAGTNNFSRPISHCACSSNLLPVGPVTGGQISISFPEPSLPLSSGTGNEDLWDKAFQLDISLVRIRACATTPEARKQ